MKRKLDIPLKEEVESFGFPTDNGKSTISSTMRGTEVLELPDFTPAVKRSLRNNVKMCGQW